MILACEHDVIVHIFQVYSAKGIIYNFTSSPKRPLPSGTGPTDGRQTNYQIIHKPKQGILKGGAPEIIT